MTQQSLLQNYQIMARNIIVNNEDLYNIKISRNIHEQLNKIPNYKIFESFIYNTGLNCQFIKIGYNINNTNCHLCLGVHEINNEIMEKIYYKTWKNQLVDTHNELCKLFWKKKIQEINEDFMMNYWSIENSWIWDWEVGNQWFPHTPSLT